MSTRTSALGLNKYHKSMNPGNCCALLAALAVTAAGCHKKTTPTPAVSEQTTNPAVGEAPQPLVGEVHPFMTSQLRIFLQQNGRLPSDFAELARTRLDVVPRAPPGMKWAIDPVSQEVKLVKR